MSVAPLAYRWSADEFIRAWQARVFNHRVELVEGEVLPVVIGLWHGRTQVRLTRLLPDADVEILSATLPLPGQDTLPDPDCWVLRAGAEPVEAFGDKVQVWDPIDVLLVVEVSDESVLHDLNTKARLYGRAGFAVYWVVTRDAIFEHTDASPEGYRSRREYRRGERIPVRYAVSDLAVTDVLGEATA